MLKFGRFMDKASELGKDCIATGHYVQVEQSASGRYLLKKGVDLSKDQSYVLYSLTQDQLARTVFPLGGYTKAQVREIALDEGYGNTNKGESQDICFIPDGDYVRFIREYTGEPPKKGRFIDTNGKDLGENNGVSSYTIGQRRGLGLSMPHPPYVIELRPEDNTVVVGKEDMLYSKSLNAEDINLIPVDKLDAPIRAQVKIRYSDPGHPAVVHQIDENKLHIEFNEAKRAITKGQAAVIYDGDVVIGGGTIARC
jgi:tRNA-specific 2-thiouridylase